MSSSSRNATLARCCALSVAAVLACSAAPAALAQDRYFTPEVSVAAEHHSNLDLANGASTRKQDVEGYMADIAATFGVRSQRGRFELRPNVVVQEYPDRDELEQTNRYLDMRAEYGGLRSHFDVVARYSHEDEYRSQLPAAAFDNFDPSDPTSGSSGRIIDVQQFVERIYVRPTYSHEVTQLLSVGLTGNYETVDYSFNNPDRVDYDSRYAQGYLGWALGQRSNLNTGVYYSAFDADNGNKTSAVGGSVSWEQRWTPTFRGSFTVNGERSTSEFALLPDQKNTNLSFNASVERRDLKGRLRFEAGRQFWPSSQGSRARSDQIRIQYSRQMTQLWSYSTAVRLFRTRGEEDNGSADRDYIRGSLDLTRQMSPRWFVAAGYQYLMQKYEVDSRSANDSVFRVSVGFRGLDPQ